MARLPMPGLPTVKPRGVDRRFNGRLNAPYLEASGLPWNERREQRDRRSGENGGQAFHASAPGEVVFLSAFEESPDALVIFNRQGFMLIANRQCERLFGYQRENLLGRSIEMLLPERSWADALDWQDAEIPLESPLRLSLTGCRQDRTEFPLELSVSPLHASRYALLLAVLRDIAASSLALDAMQQNYAGLAEANDRLRADMAALERKIAEQARRRSNAGSRKNGR